MKLPKTLIYALGCMNELNKRPCEYIRVKEIVSSQQIPPAYCQKVLLLLTRCGYAESVKGKGFHLICSLNAIKAIDFIQSVENETKSGDLRRDNAGLERELLKRITETLSQTTVADLMESKV